MRDAKWEDLRHEFEIKKRNLSWKLSEIKLDSRLIVLRKYKGGILKRITGPCLKISFVILIPFTEEKKTNSYQIVQSNELSIAKFIYPLRSCEAFSTWQYEVKYGILGIIKGDKDVNLLLRLIAGIFSQNARFDLLTTVKTLSTLHFNLIFF